jgi:hypothetical protein
MSEHDRGSGDEVNARVLIDTGDGRVMSMPLNRGYPKPRGGDEVLKSDFWDALKTVKAAAAPS